MYPLDPAEELRAFLELSPQRVGCAEMRCMEDVDDVQVGIEGCIEVRCLPVKRPSLALLLQTPRAGSLGAEEPASAFVVNLILKQL